MVKQKLPFLEAICWDLYNAYALTPEQMLTRYRDGLEYEGILGEIEDDEREFIQSLEQDIGGVVERHTRRI